MDKNRVARELVRLAKQLVSADGVRVFYLGGGKSAVTGVPSSIADALRKAFPRTFLNGRKEGGTYTFYISEKMESKVKQWLKENSTEAKGSRMWDLGPGEMPSKGDTVMEKNRVARELVRIAKALMGDDAWTPMRRDVDLGRRNVDVLQSLTTYAPKVTKEMKKAAAMSLAKQGYDVDSNGELLTTEWSEYLTFTDPDANSNKYHYYVIFSFVPEGASPIYVGFNCSGRIGIIERAYDLTKKFNHGPANSESQAKSAIMAHMRTKLAKGYQPAPRVRG